MNEKEIQLEAEIERRIELMEQKDYPFVKKMERRDYVQVAVLILFCFAGLVAGIWL